MDLKSYGSPNIYYEDNILDKLSTAEALEQIMDELSPSMRNNFHRLANGVAISSSKKQALFDRVKEILGEDW